MGQCNDAYSAIRIALALADAFGCGVNDLPLSLVLCWFEQKAVCILIALLALGIRNIRLGPTLPAVPLAGGGARPAGTVRPQAHCHPGSRPAGHSGRVRFRLVILQQTRNSELAVLPVEEISLAPDPDADASAPEAPADSDDTNGTEAAAASDAPAQAPHTEAPAAAQPAAPAVPTLPQTGTTGWMAGVLATWAPPVLPQIKAFLSPECSASLRANSSKPPYPRAQRRVRRFCLYAAHSSGARGVSHKKRRNVCSIFGAAVT